MTVEWFGDEILRDTNRVMARAEKEIAEDVLKDAISILKRNSESTTGKKKAYGNSPGGLADQMYVIKSKFAMGGYLIWCQGPKDWKAPYHASFIELGTHKTRNMAAQPFMRPALKKNKRNAKRKFQEALNTV